MERRLTPGKPAIKVIVANSEKDPGTNQRLRVKVLHGGHAACILSNVSRSRQTADPGVALLPHG
jgi:hypothetical protein